MIILGAFTPSFATCSGVKKFKLLPENYLPLTAWTKLSRKVDMTLLHNYFYVIVCILSDRPPWLHLVDDQCLHHVRRFML